MNFELSYENWQSMDRKISEQRKEYVCGVQALKRKGNLRLKDMSIGPVSLGHLE